MYKSPVSAFHKEVDEFNKQLIRTTLGAHGGNRTYTARALGLQRTYLLRLLRQFEIQSRVPSRHQRHSPNGE